MDLSYWLCPLILPRYFCWFFPAVVYVMSGRLKIFLTHGLSDLDNSYFGRPLFSNWMRRLKMLANDLTQFFFLGDLGSARIVFRKLLDLALRCQLGGLLMVNWLDDDDRLELSTEDDNGVNGWISVFFDKLWQAFAFWIFQCS